MRETVEIPCLELKHFTDNTPPAATAVVMSLWDKAIDSLKDKHKKNVDFQRADKYAILADILEEIPKKEQACVERRLKHKRKNGEFVVLYDVFEKMVKWVTWLCSTILDNLPFPGLPYDSSCK